MYTERSSGLFAPITHHHIFILASSLILSEVLNRYLV